MKARVIILAAILVLGSFGLASGQSVFVDANEIQGLDENGMIPAEGCDLVIPVRFTNNGEARSCISNGFHFTTDGITFAGIEGAWNPAYPWDLERAMALVQFPMFFDVGLFINYFDNGVGFAGLSSSGSGLPAGFDDVAYYIMLEGVQGNLGDGWLTMDSSFWLPANVWLWCGEPTVYPAWGGPYEFALPCELCEPYTTCWPQPTSLGTLENDGMLNIIIHEEDNDQVILESIVVQEKLRPQAEPYIDGDSIVVKCLLKRFLGMSGFRPIPPEGIESTYTVEYDKIGGGHQILIGDFTTRSLIGDINLDGKTDLADVQFMADYFWGDGSKCEYEEFMDVDGNGQLDIRDALKLIDVAGI